MDWVYVRLPFETPLREAIHRLKYDNKRYLASELAAIAAPALEPATAIDAVVAVPLHPAREAVRGYNQSDLIARALGKLLDRPVTPELLRRQRVTPPQTSLARADRLQNVRGAFAAAPAARGLRVLLVDDVLTTGATIDACARALRRARAQWVGALVVAHQPAEPRADP
ncbi:MAG: ComF family protein [Actinobacteria bacterium]|nr:ComF family protein [Actinomycetota bacterium]